MPKLEWIGKDAVVNHDKQVPYRLLHCDPKRSAGDPEAGNLIVQGDNLNALKALLPYYAGKVKCIYIDPPYNTGNENWVYNDNSNAPEIKAWRDKVVARDDLDRHDRWLCMMYPRLKLLHKFLSDDGALVVSIDDSELCNLRLALNEIFGERSFVVNATWFKRVSPANDATFFSSDHEHVVVYAKSIDTWRPNRLPRNERQLANFSNPDNDPRGLWSSSTYTCNKSADERPNLYFPILNPNTGAEVWPRKTAVWKNDRSRHERNVAEGRLYWGVNGQSRMPRLKKYLTEMKGVVPRSLFHYDDYGHTQGARTEILELIDDSDFVTPKPTRLIKRILQIASDPDSLILDSFAGSGTTMHAVMALNREDGGNRRCIMVEMEDEIATKVTTERIRRVMQQDGARDDEGFRYCTLGEPLFDEAGSIREDVRFRDLAHHVFFSETGIPLPKRGKGTSSAMPYLGMHNDTAYFLLFNGILGDKSPGGGNVLTRKTLVACPCPDGFKGKRVIFGEANRLGDATLRKEGVVFRHLPYDLKTG